MLNNKGQSLVLFILIIPIILGIMALVIDMGNVLSKKNEIDNVIEFVLDYGLDEQQVNNTLEDEGLEDIENLGVIENEITDDYLEDGSLDKEEAIKVLLDYNLKNCENEVVIEGEKIIISSKMYVEGIFSRILNVKGFAIESEYRGYIEENKEVIKKIK